MQYLYMALAIGAEMVANYFLKSSDSFRKILPDIACVLFFVISYVSFSKSLEKINMAVAYATWCGGGIILTTVLSCFVFGEKINLSGLIGIILVLSGCVILNLNGAA